MFSQTWHLEPPHPQQSTLISTGYNLDLTMYSFFLSTSISHYRVRWKDLLKFFITIKESGSKSLINLPRSLTFGWYVATKGIPYSEDFLTGGFLPKITLSIWPFTTFSG